MTLHNDVSDIIYGYKCIYETGKSMNVNAAQYYLNYDNVINNQI